MSFKNECVKSTFCLVTALVCVAWSAGVSAQTTIAGGSVGSQTWTAANSPYIIQGDVRVKPGGSLTIEAGVEVHFVDGDNMSAGRDTSKTELIVEGSIDVDGTAAQPVRFIPDTGTTAAGTNRKHWRGVEITEDATSATFDHLHLENAEVGILVYADTTIKNSRIRNAYLRAIDLFDGTATVESTRIYENHLAAIRVHAVGELHLFNSIIYANEQDGVRMWLTDESTAAHVLDGNTIHGNASEGVAISALADTQASVDVVNCNVTFNGGAGVVFDRDLEDAQIRYSNAWQNGGRDHPGLSRHRGPGLLSSNPLYVDDDQGDFELTSRSPSRNNGDAGQDIGAVQYQGVPTQELTGYLWEDTTFTAADSPYLVEGDLTIPEGVTLTIEAGATIGVYGLDFQRAGRNGIEIDVAGAIDVNGTRMRPVRVIRKDGTTAIGEKRDAWIALRILETATRAEIDWLELQNAKHGLMSFSPHTEIRGGLFRNNKRQGIYVGGGRAEIDGALVRDNGWAAGIRVERGELYLVNSIIRDNEGDGVDITLAEQSTAEHEVRNNTIYRNADAGLSVSSWPDTDAKAIVSNTIITHNSGTGLAPPRYAFTYVSHSNVWGNADGDYGGNRSLEGGLHEGNSTLSARPLYANAPDDLRLTSLSPGLDTGKSYGAPALDFDGNARPADGDGINGAEYDMGAFEFGASAVCGDDVIGTGEACDDGNVADGDGCSSTCENEDSGGEPDAGADAGVDAGGDAGTNAGPDASTSGDVGLDVDGRSAADAGQHAGPDAGAGMGGESSPGNDNGSGCSSSGDGPGPASALYLLIMAVVLGVLRRTR
jgi:cysteine-rich repeat protein